MMQTTKIYLNIFISFLSLLGFLQTLLMTETLWAQNEPSTLKSPSSKAPVAPKGPNVLDFDADVIEGERTGPSILIQMDLQAPNLDTLVFQRKNFNDFHSIDMKRKPNYRGQ